MFRKCLQKKKCKQDIHLIGDIGGTNTRLSIFIDNTPFFEKTFLNDKFNEKNGLLIICNKFIEEFETIYKLTNYHLVKICLGIPGIITNNKVFINNREQWGVVDLTLVNEYFNYIFNKKTILYTLNDFQIQSYGIIGLSPNDSRFYQLNKGRYTHNANKVVIGAGTGLGQSYLTCCGDKYISHQSEGGNIDFSPKNKKEIDLFDFIRNTQNLCRVTNEDIISGRGIQNIYKFFYFRQYKILPKLNIKTKYISKRSLEDLDNVKISIFTETMKLWVSLYGSIVGDLVCNILPRGGVYIVGGMVVKNKKWFTGNQSSFFLDNYLNKGFLSKFLSKIPIFLITDLALSDNLPKSGAMYYLNNI